MCLALLGSLVCLMPAAHGEGFDFGSHWRLAEVGSFRDNGHRGEVVLNGFWAQLPEGVDELSEGKRVRVPDPGRQREARRVVREFVLPDGWAGRRVTLGVHRVGGTVKLNGQTIYEGREAFVEVPLTGLEAGRTHQLQVVGGQVATDFWLRSGPAAGGEGAVIDDSFIQTSWRKQTATLRLAGSASAGSKVDLEAHITTASNGKVVWAFPSAAVVADSNGRWEVELESPWGGVKAWSHRDPNLYHYVATASVGGEVMDELLPRRFGFREVWVEDGGFVLNGVPVTIVDDTWERGAGGNRWQAEKAIDLVKSLGITGGFRLNHPVEVAVADEKGLLLMYNAGSRVRFNIWDPKSGLTAMGGTDGLGDIERTVRAMREHPSIIVWYSAAPYALASMHPQLAGQQFNPWEYFPLNRFSETGREGQLILRDTRDAVRELDPTRHLTTANGPFSPIETATRYLCDDLDLQEREEFFDHWFRSGPDRKTIWTTEMGVPIPGHQFIRRIDFQLPQGNPWPRIHIENKARYFGPSVYHEESDEVIRTEYLNHRWTANMRNEALQELHAFNIERYYRAWRTYGVSFSAHHVLNEVAFANRKREHASPEIRFGFKALDDPRVPGFSRITAATYIPNPAIDDVLPAAKTFLEVTRPLLGYIGGPDTRFTAKDHHTTAGQRFRKAYIVINDLMEPVQIDAAWQLQDVSGAVVTEGRLRGEVAAGARALTDFPIEFDAPVVTEKTRYTLRVTHAELEDATLDDAFDLTVFPAVDKPQPVKTDRTVWYVNISDDLTHERQHVIINRDNQALLQALGLDARLVTGMRTFEYKGFSPSASNDFFRGRELITEGKPAPGDLLIIPRGTLEANVDGRQHTLRTLQRMGLDDLVEQGLRVLVLEQNLDNVFGINTERTRPRSAFIAAKGHPVFAGLDDEDLSYWNGASDLTTAITPISVTANQFPERMFNISNTNAVASRPFIRPQVGAVRALAVSGFDLQESPLLEVTRGKGRVIFCQFDVTNRYGQDPAATRLLDNIVRYLLDAPEPDPSRGDVAVLAPEAEDVEVLSHVFRMAVPEGETGWGITPGELFNREAIYRNNWITRELPHGELPVFISPNHAERPAVIRMTDGHAETTFTPDLFDTGWMKRKAAWVHAALRVNQGGSSFEGPALQHHGSLIHLYPYEWIEGFVHPYTFNIW